MDNSNLNADDFRLRFFVQIYTTFAKKTVNCDKNNLYTSRQTRKYVLYCIHHLKGGFAL